MDTKELRKKTASDLTKMLTEKREALSKFRFGIAGSKIKDVKEGKNLKREIAQILTITKETK
ncbi:MAG: 50S ribosomal protein L29 [Candidatus Paceibacterota bacterium]|jgi:ribosomal protein L29